MSSEKNEWLGSLVPCCVGLNWRPVFPGVGSLACLMKNDDQAIFPCELHTRVDPNENPAELRKSNIPMMPLSSPFGGKPPVWENTRVGGLWSTLGDRGWGRQRAMCLHELLDPVPFFEKWQPARLCI